MIIVGQDKETINNFDNILGIQIDEHIFNSNGEKDYEIKVITEKRVANIGVYETKERAKEVLQDILKHAQESISYHAVGSGVWQKHESVYEMPED